MLRITEAIFIKKKYIYIYIKLPQFSSIPPLPPHDIISFKKFPLKKKIKNKKIKKKRFSLLQKAIAGERVESMKKVSEGEASHRQNVRKKHLQSIPSGTE